VHSLRACRPRPEPPPTPIEAAAASSGFGWPQVQTNPPPPSLAPTLARRRARLPHRAATSPAQWSQRPPPLATGAATSSALSLPNRAQESTPKDLRVDPRLRPTGPGRRFAEIWPDRRRPVLGDCIAKSQIFLRA
jgi:hypothetical protein